jgi:hypothetical protein
MPITRPIAEMEFHGILINTAFYYNLRQDLQDRKLMIEHNLRHLFQQGFNPESSNDIKRLNESLASAFQSDCKDLASCISPSKLAWDSRHPMRAMIKEHRSVAIMALPQASGLLDFMMRTEEGDRVSAFFDQFGTPTGRIIASNPSLQCAVKSFYYVPVKRWTLADELYHWESNPEFKVQLESLLRRLGRGDRERVRVINKSRITRRSLDPATLELYDGYELADLIRLERRPVKDQPRRRSGQGSSAKMRRFAQSWKAVVQYRHSHYRNHSNSSLQVEVSIRFIIRLGAPMTPNEKEVEGLRESIAHPYKYLNDDDLLEELISRQRHVKFREGFVAAAGYALVAADYSQFELRVLAHFCKDASLCAAFYGDQDVFKSIAATWLKKHVSAVSKDERDLVKQICYKKIYGAGPEAIATDLGISIAQAKEKMEDFMASYPQIDEFIKSTIANCRRDGYVETLLGRRLYFPNINHDNWKTRGKDERAAVNFVCQGSAADIIKMAMINIHHQIQETIVAKDDRYRELSAGGSQSRAQCARLVHMIHDELLYEVRIEHVEQVASILKNCMERCVQLRVPLKINLKLGSTWGSTIAYSQYIDHLLNRSQLSSKRSTRGSLGTLTPARLDNLELLRAAEARESSREEACAAAATTTTAAATGTNYPASSSQHAVMRDDGVYLTREVVLNFDITSP